MLIRIFKFRTANSLLRACAGLLMLTALPAAAANKSGPAKSAPTKTAPSKAVKVEDGFKPFAIITERNVFNANRSLPPPPAAAKLKVPPPPKIEAFALLGTMSTERGSVAFFDGTSTTYRKAVETGDMLGTYTVASIEHDRVTLTAGERELCLPIKMQFRREDQGEWLLADLPDNFQPTAAPPGQVYQSRKPDPKSYSPAQIRDYILSKNQRKIDQYAGDPSKAEKLWKVLDKEIEGRIKKLDSNKEMDGRDKKLDKRDRRMQ